MTTKYLLAELAQRRINKGNQGPNEDIGIQEVFIHITQAFGTVVKASYFIDKNDGITEVKGTFVYSFKNIVPVLDADLQMYYCVLPSSYLDLPREMGIQYVNFMQSGNPDQPQTRPMLRVPNNWAAMSVGLAVASLQTRTPFYVEGNSLYFPKMTATDATKNLLIKLAVSLDGIDEDTQINVPPEIASAVVDMVVAKFMPEKQLPDAKEGDKL